MATTLLYAGNRSNSGTAQLSIASGLVPLGQTGSFSDPEVANLSQKHYLEVPGSAGVTVVAGPPTVQTVKIYDWPHGSFVLTFGGQSCVLSTEATPTDVQTAFQALSSVGTGNALVTGGQGGPYVVTFAGTLAGATQAAIVASGTDLSATPNLTGFNYRQVGN